MIKDKDYFDYEHSDWGGYGSVLDVQRIAALEVNTAAPTDNSGWQWVRERRQALRDMWPRRRRRNKIMCPVTLIYTDHPSGIDYKAWGLVEDGVKYRQNKRARESERHLCVWHEYWGYTSRVREPGRGSFTSRRETSFWSLPGLICNLLGAQITEAYAPYGWGPDNRTYTKKQYGCEPQEEVFLPDALWLPDERELPCRGDRKVKMAYLMKHEAEMLQDLVNAWNWKMEQVKRDAEHKGQSLLVGLAEGSLKTSDFDAQVEVSRGNGNS